MKRNYTTANSGRPQTVTLRKKVKKTGSKMRPRSDISCTELGGICQPNRFICQGRYLADRCSGAKPRQCCTPGTVTQVITVDTDWYSSLEGQMRTMWFLCSSILQVWSKLFYLFWILFYWTFSHLVSHMKLNPQTQERKILRKQKWFSHLPLSSSIDLTNGDLKSHDNMSLWQCSCINVWHTTDIKVSIHDI